MDILQLIGVDLSAFVDNPLIISALSGAADGIVIGLIVGAIIWAIMGAPDTLGRALLLAVLLGIAVIVWQVAQISVVVGSGMGELLDSFNNNPAVGKMFLQAGAYALTAMFVGAFLGVVSQVPQLVLQGGIIGVFLGAFVGALLGGGLFYLGVSVSTLVYRLLVVLGVWALLVTFSGRG